MWGRCGEREGGVGATRGAREGDGAEGTRWGMPERQGGKGGIRKTNGVKGGGSGTFHPPTKR